MTTSSKLASEIVGNIKTTNHDEQTLDIRALDSGKLNLSGGTMTGALNQSPGLQNSTPMPHTADFLSDFIVSGFNAAFPNNTLTLTIPGGILYANGQRVVKSGSDADLTHIYAIQTDTYVDVGQDALVTYISQGTGGVEPALTANSTRVLKVTTNQTAIAAITPYPVGQVNVRSTGVLRSNGDAVWTAGNDGQGSGLDTDLIRSVNPDTLWASLRAGHNLTGGGDIKWLSNVFSWDTRFIVISLGNGAHFAAQGFYSIVQPPSGQGITGYGGAPARTATSTGIPLNAWEGLYYELPINGNSQSQPGNFVVVSYTSAFTIPTNWVMLAQVNGDSTRLKVGTGITLASGQTWSFQSGMAQTNGDPAQVFSVANATQNYHALTLGQANSLFLKSSNASFTGRNTVNTVDDGVSDWQVGGKGRYSGQLWLNSGNPDDHLLVERKSTTANLGVEMQFKNSNHTLFAVGLDGNGWGYLNNTNGLAIATNNGHVSIGGANDDGFNVLSINGPARFYRTTTNTASDKVNWWFPVGTLTINTNGGSMVSRLRLQKTGQAAVAGSNESIDVVVRVNQPTLGGTPFIELVSGFSTGFLPGQIAFVMTANTGSMLGGTFYVQCNQSFEAVNYAFLDTYLHMASLSVNPSDNGGVSVLPTGTVYNPTAAVASINGNLLVNKQTDDGNTWQVGGTGSFTSYVYTPTAPTTDNSTKLATTAFVANAIAGTAAPIKDPVFQGVPKAPTATGTDASQQIATTAFVAGNYLGNSNNLAALTDKVAARTNLGLGSAALLASNAVLQAANNLSDVASAATARANLGLSTMALQSASNVNITGGTITGIATMGFNALLLDGATDNGTGEALQSFGTIGSSVGGSGIAAMLGGDDTASPGRSNNTNKKVRVALPHYANPNKVALLHGTSTATQNVVELGGGSSSMYAASQVNIYTAANSTTTTGSLRMSFDPTGRVRMNGMTDDTVSLFQVPGQVNVQGIKFGSAGTTLAWTFSNSFSITFPQINAYAWQKMDLSVAGAALGDTVDIGLPGAFTGGLIYQGLVTAAGTVSIIAYNITGQAIAPPANNFRVTVLRFQ